MELVIEARNLVKRLGKKTLISGVQIEVRQGEVFGIYGPSGSGKSSLIKMIYCNSPTSSGDLYVLGLNAEENPSKVKSRIGVVPQGESLDLDFDVLDNLLIFSSYHGVPQSQALPLAKKLLRNLHLDDYTNDPVEALPLGARRRLMVARCLMNQPELIFLDEPTAALPPDEKQQMWQIFKELKKQGKTLVLSSSDPREVAEVCDKVIILNQGMSLRQGSPSEIISDVIGSEVIDVKIKASELDYYTKKIQNNYTYQIVNNGLRIYLKENQSHKEALDHVSGQHISVRKANLEDVYLKLTGAEFWSKERRK